MFPFFKSFLFSLFHLSSPCPCGGALGGGDDGGDGGYRVRGGGPEPARRGGRREPGLAGGLGPRCAHRGLLRRR